MSLDSVVEFYKNSISSSGLVFRHTKITYYGFSVSFCLSVLMTWVFLISLALRLYILWGFALLVSVIGIAIFFFVKFNSNAKKVLHRKYGFEPIGFVWKTKEFEKLQYNSLKDYLLENDLYCEKKLKLLVDLLHREAERRKVPSFIVPSVFLAFVVPLWIQVIGVVYKQITTLSYAVAYMIIIVFVIFVVISFIGMIKNTFIEVKEIFFLDECQVMKRLALFLEEIMLAIPSQTECSRDIS